MTNSTMRIAIVASGMQIAAAQQAAPAVQPAPAKQAPAASAAKASGDSSRRRFNPEDLNPHTGYDDPYEPHERTAPPAAPRELWRAPGGVVIEENGAHGYGSSSPAERNEAPTRPQRQAPEGDYRRMPSVDEFPPIGQREYAAKAPMYSEQKSRGQPLEPPAPQPDPPRGGLLHRLVGGGKGRRS
jgi:hypothetical protein